MTTNRLLLGLMFAVLITVAAQPAYAASVRTADVPPWATTYAAKAEAAQERVGPRYGRTLKIAVQRQVGLRHILRNRVPVRRVVCKRIRWNRPAKVGIWRCIVVSRSGGATYRHVYAVKSLEDGSLPVVRLRYAIGGATTSHG
jgi:ribosomal protein L37AE/L43A